MFSSGTGLEFKVCSCMYAPNGSLGSHVGGVKTIVKSNQYCRIRLISNPDCVDAESFDRLDFASTIPQSPPGIPR